MPDPQGNVATVQISVEWAAIQATYTQNPQEAIAMAIRLLERQDLSHWERAQAHNFICWLYSVHLGCGNGWAICHGIYASAIADHLDMSGKNPMEVRQASLFAVACHANAAIAVRLHGRYDDAVEHYDKALQHIDRSALTKLRPQILCDRAGAYYYSGNLDSCARDASHALEFANHEDGTLLAQVGALNALGNVALARGNFEPAARHFHRATALCRDEERLPLADRLLILHSLALLGIYQSDLIDAGRFGQELLKLSTRANDTAGIALGRAVMAWVKHQQGAWIEAQALAASAYQVAVQSERHWLGVEVGRVIGKMS